MSRRAFVRWLLAIGAVLVGLSAWFSLLVKKKFIPEDQTVAPPVSATEPPQATASTLGGTSASWPANVLFYLK